MSVLKKIFSVLLYSLLAAVVFVTVVWAWQEGKSRSARFITRAIKSQTLPFDLQFDKLTVSFLQVKITLHKVVLKPTSRTWYEPVSVDRVFISPDYFSLLKGRFLVKVTLLKPSVTMSSLVFQKIGGQKNQKKTFLSFFWPQVSSLPGLYLKVRGASLQVPQHEKNLSLRALALDMDARIYPPSREISLNLNSDMLELADTPPFVVAFKGSLQGERVFIKKFHVQNHRSWWKLSAHRDKKDYGIRMISVFTAEDLLPWVQMVSPGFELPFHFRQVHLRGFIQKKLSHFSGDFDFQASSFSIKDVFLSRVKATGTLRKKSLRFKSFRIWHPHQWDVDLSQMRVRLKRPYSFSGSLNVVDAQLADVFKTFHLKKIPVSARSRGRFYCRGGFYRFRFKCRGLSRFQDILVRGGKDFQILKLPSLKVKNRFEFSRSGSFLVFAKGNRGDRSELQFQGVWDKSGVFSAWYKGDLRLGDIGDLAHLSPKGRFVVEEGTLSAGKKSLQIEARLKMQNLVLSRFHLGNLSTRFQYSEKNILHFKNIKGHIQKSHYTGRVSVDVKKDRLKAFAHLPRARLSDLKEILKTRGPQLPFPAQGRGSLTAYFNTDLKAGQLSYDLQSRFSEVLWKGEFFKQVSLDLSSKQGRITFRNARFFKDTGFIQVKGGVSSRGGLNLHLKGQGLKLQEFEYLREKTGAGNLLGDMNFAMDLKGRVLNPSLKGDVDVYNTFFRNQALKDSRIHVRLNRQSMQIKGLVAGVLNIKKWVFPYEDDKRVQFQARLLRFNLGEFFFPGQRFHYAPARFESDIQGSWDFSYKKNRPFSSLTGRFAVEKFNIKSEFQTLSPARPFSVHFKKGRIHTRGFALLSKKGTRRLDVRSDLKDSTLHLKGDISLSFLTFLTPFLKDLRGDMHVDLKLQPYMFHLRPRGNLILTHTLLRLAGGVEAFEDISSHIQWDGSQMHISSLKALFSGGKLNAKGRLSFQKEGKVFVDLKGPFENVRFDSLPGFFATGSGQFRIQGPGFPYTLSLNTRLHYAQMDREIDTSGVRPVFISSLLPETSKKNFEPLNLDLKLFFTEQPLLIKNSTLQSSVKGRLHIKGPLSAPLMRGDLYSLPGGVLTFRDHEFTVTSGKLVYQNQAPSNPQIHLTATTQATEYHQEGDGNTEYSILLKVRGTGNSPVLNLSSTPGLSENEILSLLAFGTRSIVFETGDQVSDMDKYSYYSYHLGTAMFEKAIGRGVKDTFGVDQFSIVSYRNPKKRSTSTKLTVGKKIMDRLTVSASQTFLEDDPESDIKAEYKIKNHFSLVGFWKNESQRNTGDRGGNELGFDVEYNVDF